MANLLSDKARALRPYVPGEQPKDKNLIKLNTNESPYPPSPKVRVALSEGNMDELRLYPDPDCTELKKAVSRFVDIPVENIFIGNGSDEILAFAFAAFYWNKQVVFPEITYSFYPVYCDLFDIAMETVPMQGDKVRLEKFIGCGKGVVLANPNAPTGEYIPVRGIEEVVKSNPDHVVLVDEAYIDFGGESCAGLTRNHDNLLVVQTLSKSRALAGLRVGFAFGDKTLISGLEMVKNSFNSYTVNRLSQQAAIAAMGDAAYNRKIQKWIMDTRDKTQKKLQSLGFHVTESMANFIFARHPDMKGMELYSRLREAGILVRHFDRPGIEDHIRITVGTGEDMERLLAALGKIIEGGT
ncbi:MAG: histidinol-phosphate transaminase [Clostridia bacterium]